MVRKRANILTVEEFAGLQASILQTDRYILNVCTGDTGEGKSCVVSQLAEEVSIKTKTLFSYMSNMTYLRSELKLWIDGKGLKKTDRKPEYSSIIADELVSLFFKRNWYDRDQIDGIELLNKCRDRHLCISGNIPDFWDLDSAIYSLITFWIHVHERGLAWVFRRDRNPFTKDKWNAKENQKIFYKDGSPERSRNYVCTVVFDDWTPEKKKEYYDVRNTKRRKTEGQRQMKDNYKKLKEQRDNAIRFCFEIDNKLKHTELSKIVGLDHSTIRKIKLGIR